MAQQLLPLFPLNLVLFPRTPLPLHIFEERYKEMIRDVMENKGEFGIVLAGEKGIVNMGCSATVEKIVQEYPDGRLDLLALGRRRFEIVMLNDEKSYLRGNVEFFDDDEFEPISPDMQKRVMDGYQDVVSLDADATPDPAMDDPQLSFQLAQVVPDLDFRQVLLSTRSESDRMRRLAEFLPAYSSRQRQTQHMRELAPRNGHGKWPPGV